MQIDVCGNERYSASVLAPIRRPHAWATCDARRRRRDVQFQPADNIAKPSSGLAHLQITVNTVTVAVTVTVCFFVLVQAHTQHAPEEIADMIILDAGSRFPQSRLSPTKAQNGRMMAKNLFSPRLRAVLGRRQRGWRRCAMFQPAHDMTQPPGRFAHLCDRIHPVVFRHRFFWVRGGCHRRFRCNGRLLNLIRRPLLAAKMVTSD